jgi:hypothetical protein
MVFQQLSLLAGGACLGAFFYKTFRWNNYKGLGVCTLDNYDRLGKKYWIIQSKGWDSKKSIMTEDTFQHFFEFHVKHKNGYVLSWDILLSAVKMNPQNIFLIGKDQMTSTLKKVAVSDGLDIMSKWDTLHKTQFDDEVLAFARDRFGDRVDQYLKN